MPLAKCPYWGIRCLSIELPDHRQSFTVRLASDCRSAPEHKCGWGVPVGHEDTMGRDFSIIEKAQGSVALLLALCPRGLP